MPLEFQMVSYAIEDQAEEIEVALQSNWEPFAVYRGEVWFRRQYHNEDREPRSSTIHPNAAGNEADRGD